MQRSPQCAMLYAPSPWEADRGVDPNENSGLAHVGPPRF
jgi:hypothetical protein